MNHKPLFVGLWPYNAAMNKPGPVEPGTLWVVATPIGNRADLSQRARELLAVVPMLAVEDSRISQRLLGHRDQPVQMVAVHEHNEKRQIQKLLARLQAGADVALVSDAGTPLISDPGYRLVQAAHEHGIRVSPVPGPCAAIAALSVAGVASDRFWFEGFLPTRSEARRHRLQALASVPVSLIFYVPARDLVDMLEDCAAELGRRRPAALARELTKLHETVLRSDLAALADRCRDDPDQARGEAVVVVAGSDAEPLAAVDPLALARELAAELPPSRAAGVLGRLTGLKRRQAWELIERQRNQDQAGVPEDGASVTSNS